MVEDARERGRGEEEPHVRRWPWRLGFWLAIVWVWAWIGVYFTGLAIGSTGDCFDVQACAVQKEGMVDASNWGELFAGCALVATVLGVAAAEASRGAAAALALFCGALSVLTFNQPNSETVRATGAMAFTLAPLFVLAAWRWWSLADPRSPIHVALERFCRGISREVFG